MNGGDILTLVTVFVLAAFVGFEVISKVPSILHTPLMSGTNAVHGVVLVGSMIVLGTTHGAIELTLGFLAVVLATVNVVGGFVVTDRMLEMFKGRQPGRPAPAAAQADLAPVAAAAPMVPASTGTVTAQPVEVGETTEPEDATVVLPTHPVDNPVPDPEATRLMPNGPDDTGILP